MPVAFIVEGAGFSQEQYQQAMRSIERDDVNAPIPPGVIAHISGPSETGWRVVDVWESEEQANAFYGSPLFQNMVQSGPPLSFSPWRLYRLEVYQTLRHVD